MRDSRIKGGRAEGRGEALWTEATQEAGKSTAQYWLTYLKCHQVYRKVLCSALSYKSFIPLDNPSREDLLLPPFYGVRQVPRSHRAAEWKSWDLNPGTLAASV